MSGQPNSGHDTAPEHGAHLEGPVQLHDEGVAHGGQHIPLRPHILPVVPRQDAVLRRVLECKAEDMWNGLRCLHTFSLASW